MDSDRTLTDHKEYTEGLVRRSLEQVSHEIDPRISLADRPSIHVLDEGLALQLITSITGRAKSPQQPDKEKAPGRGTNVEQESMKDIIYVRFNFLLAGFVEPGNHSPSVYISSIVRM